MFFNIRGYKRKQFWRMPEDENKTGGWKITYEHLWAICGLSPCNMSTFWGFIFPLFSCPKFSLLVCGIWIWGWFRTKKEGSLTSSSTTYSRPVRNRTLLICNSLDTAKLRHPSTDDDFKILPAFVVQKSTSADEWLFVENKGLAQKRSLSACYLVCHVGPYQL